MELLLWRWSTGAQIVSALILAIFFGVLNLSVRRAELRPWTYAWLANLSALGATIVFWFAQPTSRLGFGFNIFAYIFSKTLFVLLLLAGASGFASAPLFRWHKRMAIWAGIYAAGAAVAIQTIDQLGAVQSSVMFALFLLSGYLLIARVRVRASRWLAAGFLLRAGLAVSEAWAHWMQLQPTRTPDSAGLRFFLASYSSFDTGAEWVIALGCVLMLYTRIEDELKETNADLLTAQEVLRQMADRDPMTGLANRRALPEIFAEVNATGATLLFFDLNDFKQINDSFGHHAGDECLRRFAGALQASFRPDDHIVRYAGDEFLVVATGLPRHRHNEIFEAMRANLKRHSRSDDQDSLPAIRFSVGVSDLAPGGDAEAAVKAADEAMYHDKAARKAIR